MADKRRIVVVSGGFDPMHSGHVSYLKEASEKGDYLIVALNSNEWLQKKKGNYFLEFNERKIIIENLYFVDEVIGFEDDKEGTCINALEKIKILHKDSEIIFCNGGDRNKTNIPEMKVEGVSFLFSVGGDKKMNSSSSILKNWHYGTEQRKWGHFINLFHENNIKVKELIVEPNKKMSFQRHFKRSEIWFISEGSCKVKHSKDESENAEEFKLSKFDTFKIKVGEWHQIINNSEKECKIIEIQYGEKTVEDDIERLNI